MTEYVKGKISKEHVIVWVHTCHSPCETEFCHLLWKQPKEGNT